MNEAQSAIDRVLRDDSPEAHVFLAMMYLRDQECDKALPEIAGARRQPEAALVNFLNGQCLMDERRADCRGRWTRSAPSSRSTRTTSTRTSTWRPAARGGATTRRCLPRAAHRLRPDDLAAKFSLGALYVALGRTEEALPLLERWRRRRPITCRLTCSWRSCTTLGGARTRPASGRSSASCRARREPLLQRVSAALGRLLGKTPAAEPPAKP